MTEAEWAACDEPAPMLDFLRDKATARKLRLFACACCRMVREAVRAPVDCKLIDRVEQEVRAAGHLDIDMAAYCYRPFVKIHPAQTPLTQALVLGLTHQDAWAAAQATAAHVPNFAQDQERGDVERSLCQLLRDIFGNPFRPVTFYPDWRADNVLALAIGIYQVGAFGLMPILADAFQNAACQDDRILTHCRGPGPHALGCWVVDLVLGKE
jgi:hypothetical protein